MSENGPFKSFSIFNHIKRISVINISGLSASGTGFYQPGSTAATPLLSNNSSGLLPTAALSSSLLQHGGATAASLLTQTAAVGPNMLSPAAGITNSNGAALLPSTGGAAVAASASGVNLSNLIAPAITSLSTPLQPPVTSGLPL